jgi:hypothetical protein
MRQPSTFVRNAGSPVAAMSLIVGGAWLIIMWTQGHAPGWSALLGLFVMGKAISAARQRKLYNAWLKEWNSVGAFGQQPAKPKKHASRALVLIAASLVIGLFTFWPVVAGRPHLRIELIWIICGLCILARLLVIIRRRSRGAQGVTTCVSWMLGGALDSPSRKEATRRLPEYAARVLTRGRPMAETVAD